MNAINYVLTMHFSHWNKLYDVMRSNTTCRALQSLSAISIKDLLPKMKSDNVHIYIYILIRDN